MPRSRAAKPNRPLGVVRAVRLPGVSATVASPSGRMAASTTTPRSTPVDWVAWRPRVVKSALSAGGGAGLPEQPARPAPTSSAKATGRAARCTAAKTGVPFFVLWPAPGGWKWLLRHDGVAVPGEAPALRRHEIVEVVDVDVGALLHGDAAAERRVERVAAQRVGAAEEAVGDAGLGVERRLVVLLQGLGVPVRQRRAHRRLAVAVVGVRGVGHLPDELATEGLRLLPHQLALRPHRERREVEDPDGLVADGVGHRPED